MLNANLETPEKCTKFNINGCVKVKLTQLGKDIFYHQYDFINEQARKIVIEPYYPKVDEDGYTEFQLHTLMSLYGKYMHNGGQVQHNTLPFDTEIIIKN